jgi:DNA-binding NtrC family response regulator
MTDSRDASTDVIARLPKLKIMSARLEVVSGPDSGAALEVTRGRARVGTARSNDLVLTDGTVSRLHCQLLVGEQTVRLVDLGSTNGTFIGGIRVHDAEIVAGDIQVGSTTIRLIPGAERAVLWLAPHGRFGELVGSSVPMRRLYAELERAAQSDATVLLQGETGTGKDLAARTIHEHSRRADGPFVTIDCGSIAPSLIESELFGHVRGAFSGATHDRKGVLERGNGGTVFFDEIGELPLALQPKLLRVLEARELRPVGSDEVRPIDIRVIAATNRPLAKSVNEGTFREDLYYRLAVIECEMPPLRDRREDIPALAASFYRRFAEDESEIPPELLADLQHRNWPGNVRELRNYVERMVVMGWDREPPRPAPAPGDPQRVEAVVLRHLPLREARAQWLEQFNALYVKALLDKTRGNITRTAELAGINRRSLQRLMTRLGLRENDSSTDDDA